MLVVIANSKFFGIRHHRRSADPSHTMVYFDMASAGFNDELLLKDVLSTWVKVGSLVGKLQVKKDRFTFGSIEGEVLRFKSQSSPMNLSINFIPGPAPGSRGCPAGQMQCFSGECIKLDQFCDGSYDCADGADEDRCGKSIHLV